MFRIYREHPDAVIPACAKPGDAGGDLSAVEHKVIPAMGSGLVSTGLRIQIPQDCYARVAPRSGLAVKSGISIGAGVVDSGYRGIVHVLMINLSNVEFVVQPGDRIAQLVMERIYTPEWIEVTDAVELDASARGEGGFGSTGTGLRPRATSE
jgi:dUTP pyrophosphatase